MGDLLLVGIQLLAQEVSNPGVDPGLETLIVYLSPATGSPLPLPPVPEALQIAPLKGRRAVLVTKPLVRLIETGRLFGKGSFKEEKGLLAQAPPVAIGHVL
jgi:hypothetical protein